MIAFVLIAIALIGITIFVVWAIAKLPARYERRQHGDLSPWNSLDVGIDPTVDEADRE